MKPMQLFFYKNIKRFARVSCLQRFLKPLASLEVLGCLRPLQPLALLEVLSLPEFLEPLASLGLVG